MEGNVCGNSKFQVIIIIIIIIIIIQKNDASPLAAETPCQHHAKNYTINFFY